MEEDYVLFALNEAGFEDIRSFQRACMLDMTGEWGEEEDRSLTEYWALVFDSLQSQLVEQKASLEYKLSVLRMKQANAETTETFNALTSARLHHLDQLEKVTAELFDLEMQRIEDDELQTLREYAEVNDERHRPVSERAYPRNKVSDNLSRMFSVLEG